jgi:hypothetical protein
MPGEFALDPEAPPSATAVGIVKETEMERMLFNFPASAYTSITTKG